MTVTPAQATQSLGSFKLEAGSSKTAVIIGGTTGIGEGVALLLAKIGCGRIIILGRDAETGRLAVGKLDAVNPAGAHEYIKSDVGYVRGMKATAEDLIRAAGNTGFDYVFMTQNGVPSGIIRENADGEEIGFAVQSQSRFALAYLLTKGGALAKNAVVMSIANTGISLDDLDVEDLSLKRRAAAGRSQALFFFDQSKRDSSVIDACTIEMNARYPQYRYLHLHPGLVKTANTSKWGTGDKPLPFPWNWVFPLGYKVSSQTPEQYAPVPVYLAVHPDAKAKFDDAKFFNSSMKSVSPGRWALQARNRELLWNKLERTIV